MAKKSAAAEATLGFKRVCPSCSTRYYDMGKNPPTCPSCSTEYNPEALLRSRRNRPLEDDEDVKVLMPRAGVPANDGDDDEAEDGAAPETVEDEEDAVEGYDELDGEAELIPDEADVEGVDLDEDLAETDDEDEDELIEDASELGGDDDFSDVAIEKDEEV